MEWNVRRDAEWQEVFQSVMLNPKPPSKNVQPDSWVSQIEVLTYDPIAFGPPLFLGPQFSFHVYVEDKGQLKQQAAAREDVNGHPDLSELPRSVPLEIRRETPRPYGVEGSKARQIFPVVGSDMGTVLGDLNSALTDGIDFTKTAIAKPIQRRDDLSFEDALVIDDDVVGVDAIDLNGSPPGTDANGAATGKMGSIRSASMMAARSGLSVWQAAMTAVAGGGGGKEKPTAVEDASGVEVGEGEDDVGDEEEEVGEEEEEG
ncbi:hypothetical protein HK101_009293 [Irineochytrium annulatum]|nr:hypothetical protein HK101_009293 [Irineochytrium annulatum]